MFLQIDSHSRIFNSHEQLGDELLKFVFMYQVHEQMQQQKEQNKPSKVTSL